VTRWAAFAGITLAVLSLLLVLARASQSLVGPHHGERRRLDRLDDGADHLDATTATAPDHDSPAAATLESSPPAPTTAALLANVAVSHGLFAVLLVGGIWLTGVPASALGVTDAPASTGLLAVAVGLGVGVAISLANAVAAGLADALGTDPSRELRELLAPESAGGWVVLLGVVLPVIAGFEELLFRAALVGGFAAGFGVSPWPLAVLSSVAFAAGHGAQGRLGVLVTGLLGLALAVAFVVTNSLLVVVVAHYVVNAAEFVAVEGLDWRPFGR
jgi:membrane protease YdiL (CAAX protease family)